MQFEQIPVTHMLSIDSFVLQVKGTCKVSIPALRRAYSLVHIVLQISFRALIWCVMEVGTTYLSLLTKPLKVYLLAKRQSPVGHCHYFL